MANSIVYLYKDCKITPEKSFLVEDVTSYLLTLTNVRIDNFQYIRQDLTVTIKLATDVFGLTAEDMLDPREAVRNYNYVEIRNKTDSIPFYYFISDIKHLSNNTLLFTLALDSINTFKKNIDYSFKKETKIIREHKDRIYNSTIQDGSGNILYRRKIDFESEGMTPTLYKQSEIDVTDERLNTDWYLMYKADNEQTEEFPPQAVSAYIIPGTPIDANAGAGGLYPFYANRMITGEVYYFGKLVNLTQSNHIVVNGVQYDCTDIAFIRKLANGNVELRRLSGYNMWLGTWQYELLCEHSAATIEILFDTRDYIYLMTSEHWQEANLRYDFFKKKLGNYLFQIKEGVTEPSGSSDVRTQLNSIEGVDRTNTTILKIIDCPYAPFQMRFDAHGWLLCPSYVEIATIAWDDQPTHQTTCLKIKPGYEGAFTSYIVDSKMNIFNKMFVSVDTENDVRDDNVESKLLHSDFNYDKFVYDSFSHPIQYEHLSEDNVKNLTLDTQLGINFITTSTVNSRFLFEFNNINDLNSVDDYDNIMVVNRNNEMPLFNSDYINYIRNGYNYDVKAKNAAIVKSSIGIASSVISTVAGGAGAGLAAGNLINTAKRTIDAGRYYTYDLTTGAKQHIQEYADAKKQLGDVGLSSLYATGQFASGISGLASNITGIIETEKAFEQKQKQMEMSSVSVSGSDDIDLLKYYSNNRAKLCNYAVSDKMKTSLSDLFYYYGYARDVAEVPNTNTRQWFNYLQCEAVLKPVSNIQRKYLEDIKSRYSQGVTFLHHKDLTWDFDQEKANNEVWLEEE